MQADTEELTRRATQLLATLIGYDSTSALSNLPLLSFIEHHLSALGIVCTKLPSPDGNKGNLLARIGPNVAGGVVLSGHTDVVPVAGQSWDSEPFALTAKGGKLYGRGTSDMKSFLAVCMAFAPEFARMKLSKPVWLAFSYDEEVGCLGAPHLLKYIEKNIPKPAFAIIGEPTEMKVVTAHKGVLSYKTTVTGLEWHSSQPHYGVNAVQVGAALVNFLSEMAADISAKGKKDKRFDPPYSTVHVGLMSGGTARNIIPKECHFNWEIRPLPTDDADAIFARFATYADEQRARIKKISPVADIVTQPISRMTGVTLPADADGAREMVMRAAKTNEEYAVSFGTEAGVFNEHGVPAIVCGPGNIKQAHQPNEFIEESQIAACVDFMLRLAESLPVS